MKLSLRPLQNSGKLRENLSWSPRRHFQTTLAMILLKTVGERSLTFFEMTGIVIPSGCEESFPWHFDSLNEARRINHFAFLWFKYTSPSQLQEFRPSRISSGPSSAPSHQCPIPQ